ncbi:hypothetical protein PISMIDRAFT_680303 [Pisolithus microcarpus 441]|uniref:Uncharacterized protein n=1 Tax=Pisolithus microcarpus 441 TaxID=765257 RepID=A0A0C9Z0F3_9AGAM|nr:hypothetical protein PISMIDRAFT_680303 [Pisolithus microcarpus 441]
MTVECPRTLLIVPFVRKGTETVALAVALGLTKVRTGITVEGAGGQLIASKVGNTTI